MTKRSSSKRDLVRGSATSYAKRDSHGRFKDMDNAGRSQRADRARKSKTRVRSGYGDQGERTR